MATVHRSEYLDYDIQELIKKERYDVKTGCPNFDGDEGHSIGGENGWDDLPF